MTGNEKAAPDWHRGDGAYDKTLSDEVTTDLTQAQRLLTLLSDGPHTFQTFDDTTAKRKGMARVMVGTLAEKAGELSALNAQGAGVFFTVNATDGKGRTAANVTHIRALFVDLDGAPLEPVGSCAIEPHLIVESSPQRWHAYWFIKAAPADAATFKRWQHGLAARFGADPSVCDLPRVMRLPGYWHRKGEPFQTRIIHESGRALYDVSELINGFGLDHPSLGPEIPVAKAEGATEGGRNSHLTSLAGSMQRRGMAREAIEAALLIENQASCKPPLPDDEVKSIPRSMARYEPERAAEETPIEPFDLSTATVGDFLDNRPPPRVWVVDDVLPLGCVALLAAAGGTGKSVAVMQLAVSVCTGLGWLGMGMERTGSVLIVSAEDDRPEAHRRLHRIADHYKAMVESSSGDWTIYDELLKERLHFLDRVGKDNRLTAKVDRVLNRTGFDDRVIATAKELPGLVLIVLDPLSRFDGGDGNDNSDGTRLIECAERIRKATGATVMLPHHVSKAGLRDAQSGQEAVRGASGLVDGARWVGMLATLRKEHAQEYGVAPEDAGKFVQFTIPKSNYAPPFAGFWIRRCDGGVLERTVLEQVDKRAEKQARRGDDRYAELLPKLKDLVRKKQEEGEPLTKRQLRGYAGGAGVFGGGESSLNAAIERAIEEGELRQHKPEGARYAQIHTW